MRVALSIRLMQECCNPVLSNSFVNEPGGVPLRLKHLLHSSAVIFGEIFHSPSARDISPYLTLTRVISALFLEAHPLVHFPIDK